VQDSKVWIVSNSYQVSSYSFFRSESCSSKSVPTQRALDGWDCQALMCLDWAIQSSWTNGTRWKLARPICGIFKLYLRSNTPLRGSPALEVLSTPAWLLSLSKHTANIP